MIKSITVTNYLGDSLKLELENPEKSGFLVGSVSGLGAGTATINTTEMATSDGAMYNSAKIPSRNIVLTLMFLWKETIEETRHLSYKYFPLKKPVTLLVETDDRLAEIEGYVETNDPTIFSSAEGSDISIICPDPYFYSAGKNGTNVTVMSNIEPAFEFPFSNESLVEPLLEMSIVNNTKEQVVVYEGDADVGVTITIHAMGTASNVTIYNVNTRESMNIDTDQLAEYTGNGIIEKDDIVI